MAPHHPVLPRGLRWEDVDLSRSIIQVRQRADRFNKIGKPKFSFHALRHAAASLFIKQGWPAKKVQTILGHSSITMTFDVYGHLFDNAEDYVDLFVKLEADLEAA
ncbi:tyrosine-type recombinase/integrase [Stappia sp. TSB10GB4]|uniref:tyrosine-type recombinase/integrase n=1 Tax=Stappia sp. TSB10GB4 TaxID=2003584 RepID=UPI001FCA7336|nr:tyrosine-type recombinase/integrase [Stappia sp. TSB10GB4]